MNRKILFLLINVAATAPASAQDVIVIPERPPSETFITVLASGARETLDTTGVSVSVFGREELDSVQGADLTRLLERAPGVSLSRNGGPGSFTGVRVRGAEAEQLLVLIDGVRVSDVAAPGGGFDFGNLLMGNLAKVELLRSSNSTIWGSQALGGVLAATTGGEGYFGSAEYGADETFYGSAGMGFAAGPAELGLQGAYFDGDGFSAAAAGTEPDGFRQAELAGQAKTALGGGVAVFANGRYADGRVELDGFPAPNFTLADTAEYQDTHQLSGAGGIEYAGSRISLRAAYSLADTERENFDPAFGPAPTYTAAGTSERAELRGRWRFADGLALDFGAEREWLRFSSLFDALHRTATAGIYAQLDYGSGPFHLAAGVRHDQHRDFGGEWSFGADASWRIAYGVRAKASYGEAFKAPTLFQLHSDFGNGSLQPETSRGVDLGVEYSHELGFVRGLATLEVTGFRRDTDGLIGFVSCFGASGGICAGRPFGTYDNIGEARAQGVEIEGQVQLMDLLTLGGAYTLLDAEDRTQGSAARGNELARRPDHAITLTADWKAGAALAFGADLRVVSDSFDDPANQVPLDGYAVLTLRGEWHATEPITLFARVENVWDESYQTAAGYATPGRGAYLGARARY